MDATVTGVVRGTALTARVFADSSDYDGTYIYEEGTVVNRDTSHGDVGRWRAAGVAASGLATTASRPGSSTARNLRQDQDSWEADPYVELVGDRRRSQQVGIYVQDEIELHRRLVATLGGRYDWSSSGDGTGRPRVGLVYRTDADTAIKFLFGAAYRAPTVFERYYVPAPTSETLQPETVQTSELVYEQHVGGGLRLTASGYLTRAWHLITQVEDNDLLYYRNVDQADSVGLELEGERRWTSGVLLRASHVVQKTSDPVHDVELTNSPRQLGLIHAAVPLLSRRLTVALEEQFVGARLTNAGEETPSVWLTNIHVSFLPSHGRLTLAARVTNLLDRRYAHPVGLEFRQQAIPQDGRGVSLRAIVRF